ncbi:MAG: amino acid adenylation domain-containing protein [Pseudomonadota bacterium]
MKQHRQHDPDLIVATLPAAPASGVVGTGRVDVSLPPGLAAHLDGSAEAGAFFATVLDLVLTTFVGEEAHTFELVDAAGEGAAARTLTSGVTPDSTIGAVREHHMRLLSQPDLVASFVEVDIHDTQALPGVQLVLCKGEVSQGDDTAGKRVQVCVGHGSTGTWSMQIAYQIGAYDPRLVERLSRKLSLAAVLVMENAETIPDPAALLLEDERALLETFSFGPTRSFPHASTLHLHFERMAAAHPDHIAVSFQSTGLTYDAFNTRVNRLAWELIGRGTGPGSRVAILMDRCTEMLVAIYAVIKAGAAYVPLDPSNPKERLEIILADSGCDLVLTDRVDRLSGKTEEVQVTETLLGQGRADNPPPTARPEDLAYIIYTSGSTGVPKGVMVEHRSVMNRMDWVHDAYPLPADGVTLQKTPISFDVSVWELFSICFAKSTLCLLPPGGEKEPEVIIETIADHRVTTIHFVPSMLETFLFYLDAVGETEGLETIHTVSASGEALTVSQVRAFHETLGLQIGARLINLYGPTEATVDVTHFDTAKMGNRTAVPIGAPIANMATVILDGSGQLSPLGGVGELVLSGVGVARGYNNRDDLTAEKFGPIEVPTFEVPERCYRTGDLARWTEDGMLEYLGRNDSQIKLRGYRIEVDEIATRVRDYPQVIDCHVLATSVDDGEPALVGFVRVDGELNRDGLRAHLSQFLPAYMLPERFISVGEYPLTPNGKLDRKTLLAQLRPVGLATS